MALYLGAVIIANLIVARCGPSASVWTAFLFIGLDLTSRDHLHEAWRRQGLAWKMSLLIGCGSWISFWLNKDSGRIALASAIAFFLAAIIDACIYGLLHGKSRFVKINGSNLVGAMVDSFVFPTLAFREIMPVLVLGQFLAKAGGGFVWSLILKRELRFGRWPKRRTLLSI